MKFKVVLVSNFPDELQADGSSLSVSDFLNQKLDAGLRNAIAFSGPISRSDLGVELSFASDAKFISVDRLLALSFVLNVRGNQTSPKDIASIYEEYIPIMGSRFSSLVMGDVSLMPIFGAYPLAFSVDSVGPG
jgi:hypothetical protein